MARKFSGGEGIEGFIDIQSSKESTTEVGPSGKVRFIELDAELLGDYFGGDGGSMKADFDAVWISEALSHFPNRHLFFENAFKVLKSGGGGKLILADWFKRENLTQAEMDSDIKPIEGMTQFEAHRRLFSLCNLTTQHSLDGMLLPPLCTKSDYVTFAKKAGFEVAAEPYDISQNVAKTW